MLDAKKLDRCTRDRQSDLNLFKLAFVRKYASQRNRSKHPFFNLYLPSLTQGLTHFPQDLMKLALYIPRIKVEI